MKGWAMEVSAVFDFLAARRFLRRRKKSRIRRSNRAMTPMRAPTIAPTWLWLLEVLLRLSAEPFAVVPDDPELEDVEVDPGDVVVVDPPRPPGACV